MKNELGKLATALILATISTAVMAQKSNDTIKIGVISDLSGPYSGQGGIGTVQAVEMAVKDFGGTVLGKPIQVLSADYQSKVDIASSVVRRWYDSDKVSAVVESTNSAAAIAMGKVAAEKKRLMIYASAGTTVLTNAECSPYGIQYTYNAYALTHGVASAVTKNGGKSWFFITVDYAAGTSFQNVAEDAIKANGGKVLGTVRHPLNSADFASYLLQAQSSGAQVVGLANFAVDTQNSIRQAAEFGITKSQILVPVLIYITDIKGLGLPVAQGMQFSTAFYWDRNQETREWSERFYKIHKGMPTQIHAGAYSATMHYLKAIAATKTDDADAVIKQMRAMPVNDFFAHDGKIRKDGLMVHDMYLGKVKKPAESKANWDLAKIIKVIPAQEAFEPISASTCPLLKAK